MDVPFFYGSLFVALLLLTFLVNLNIYYADTLHELNMLPDSRARMEGLALKAVSLDPDLQVAQYNLVVQNAFHGRTQECVEVAQKVV